LKKGTLSLSGSYYTHVVVVVEVVVVDVAVVEIDDPRQTRRTFIPPLPPLPGPTASNPLSGMAACFVMPIGGRDSQ